MVSHGKWVPTRLAEWVRDKLCTPTTLSYDGQMHQEYVFDKDGLFSRVPELLEDYDHPSFITQVILPTAPGVSNEGGSSPLLVLLPAVSWLWVSACVVGTVSARR